MHDHISFIDRAFAAEPKREETDLGEKEPVSRISGTDTDEKPPDHRRTRKNQRMADWLAAGRLTGAAEG